MKMGVINLRTLDFSEIGYHFEGNLNELNSYVYQNDNDEDNWFELIPDPHNEDLVILIIYMRSSIAMVTVINMTQISSPVCLARTVIRDVKREEEIYAGSF